MQCEALIVLLAEDFGAYVSKDSSHAAMGMGVFVALLELREG